MSSELTHRRSTILHAFNARALSPAEVAHTFVPPPGVFDALITRDNTVLIGPRGSGKTTLLKMLSPEALSAWSSDEAKHFRDQVDYTGIFVPTDISWNALLASGSMMTQAAQQLSLAAFTAHVLKCFSETIAFRLSEHSRPKWKADFEQADEAFFVQTVAESWNLHPRVPTLLGLRLALGNRLSQLGRLRAQADIASIPLKELPADAGIDIDLFSAIRLGIEVFGSIIGNTNEHWALLIDELELAPPNLREGLFDALRSGVPQLLVKLSLTPYGNTADELGVTTPLSGHDFTYIGLAHPRKQSGYVFGRELLNSELEQRFDDPQLTAESVLGPSLFDSADFDADSVDSSTPYGLGSSVHTAFVELYEKDASFAEYLGRHSVRLDDLESLRGSKRAAHIRKIRNLVIVRNHYRQEDGTLRSRKSPDIYTGTTSVLALTEGNPRQFIAMLRPMLNAMTRSTYGYVPRNAQAEAIQDAVSRFCALLATFPSAPPSAREYPASRMALLELLDVIGTYFQKRIIRDDFSANPPTAFEVDENVPRSLLYALGQAWNAGAIVHVPERNETDLLPSVKGGHFRLSHLLAPRYYLPLGLGKRIALSRVLASSGEAGRKIAVSYEETLFDA